MGMYGITYSLYHPGGSHSKEGLRIYVQKVANTTTALAQKYVVLFI